MADSKLCALVGAYLRVNLAAALEYRGSLFAQVFGMLVNDALWVAFWVLYFARFPVLRGWTLEDVLVLWASISTSYGLVMSLCYNALRIPTLVTQGQLDYYLVLPKNVLLHMLVSHMRVVNLGDVLFGPLLLLLMVKLTAVRLLVFAAATLLGAAVILGFFVLAGSLSFYAGNADTAVDQILQAMIHFSTYPTAIFDRGVRLILFTVIPAGFISTLPVELVRQFDWLRFLHLAGAAAVFLGLGIWSFCAGLRRYESGNLMAMRS